MTSSVVDLVVEEAGVVSVDVVVVVAADGEDVSWARKET